MFNRFTDTAMTTAQQKAHHALTLLLAEEGMQSAADVYTGFLARAREDAFAANHGLKRCSGTVCLGRLFGKLCKHLGGMNDSTPHVPPGNDHCSLWARDGRPVAYVFQPYRDALTAEALDRLAVFCREYQLVYTISEEQSFHYPGKTLLVMIERQQ